MNVGVRVGVRIKVLELEFRAGLAFRVIAIVRAYFQCRVRI